MGLSWAKVNSSIKEPIKFGFAGSGGFLMVTVPAEAAGLLCQSVLAGSISGKRESTRLQVSKLKQLAASQPVHLMPASSTGMDPRRAE